MGNGDGSTAMGTGITGLGNELWRVAGFGGREKRKKRELPRAFKGSRTPGSNRYRCFLSDLTGLAAKPPSDFPKNRGGEGGI